MASNPTDAKTNVSSSLLVLPITRIRRLTKEVLAQNALAAPPDAKPMAASNEASLLLAKATELFLDHLTERAFRDHTVIENDKPTVSSLEYDAVAKAVHGDGGKTSDGEARLIFLHESVPLRKTLRELRGGKGG